MITLPAYFSFFLPYTRLVHLRSPHELHCVASFFCPIVFCVYVDDEYGSLVLHLCVQQLYCCYILSHWVRISIGSLKFFLCVLECCPMFMDPPPFVVCVAVATFRLHISD